LQKDAHYKIIDLTGKTLQQGKLKSKVIDVSKLRQGEYLLGLNIDTITYTKKIIIK